MGLLVHCSPNPSSVNSTQAHLVRYASGGTGRRSTIQSRQRTASRSTPHCWRTLPSPLGSLHGRAGRLTPQPSSQIPLPAPPRQRQSQKTRPHRPYAQTYHPRQPPLEKSRFYPCFLRQLLTSCIFLIVLLGRLERARQAGVLRPVATGRRKEIGRAHV